MVFRLWEGPGLLSLSRPPAHRALEPGIHQAAAQRRALATQAIASSEQLEIHVDMGRHRDRDAVLGTGPKTPLLDRRYRVFIQTQAQTFYNPDVLGDSIGTNFQVEGYRSGIFREASL